MHGMDGIQQLITKIAGNTHLLSLNCDLLLLPGLRKKANMAYEPPLEETYKNLIHISLGESKDNHTSTVEEWDLPLIDLSELDFDRGKCIKEIAEAAREWGFFQVVNHGVSKEVLRSLQCEQMKVFHLPFERKIEENFLKLTANSYRWGNLNATSLRQILWSEALHISLMDISKLDGSLRYVQSFL